MKVVQYTPNSIYKWEPSGSNPSIYNSKDTTITTKHIKTVELTGLYDWDFLTGVLKYNVDNIRFLTKIYSAGNCQILEIISLSSILQSRDTDYILETFELIRQAKHMPVSYVVPKEAKYIIDIYDHLYEKFLKIMKNRIIIHNTYEYTSTYNSANNLVRTIFSFDHNKINKSDAAKEKRLLEKVNNES